MPAQSISSEKISKTGNRLLDGLPAQELLSVVAGSELTTLHRGKILYEKGCLISQVYFPISACLAEVARVVKHPSIGLLLIGSEGMLGATQILDVEVAPLRAIVQRAGTQGLFANRY